MMIGRTKVAETTNQTLMPATAVANGCIVPIASDVTCIDVTSHLDETKGITESALMFCYFNYKRNKMPSLSVKVNDNIWFNITNDKIVPLNLDKLLYVVVRRANTLELRVAAFGHALLALQVEKFNAYLSGMTMSTMKTKLNALLPELLNIEKYLEWKEAHVVAAGELHFVDSRLVKINLDSGAFHFKNITAEQIESIYNVLGSFPIFKNIPMSTSYQGYVHPNTCMAENANKIEATRDGMAMQFRSMALTATISEESYVTESSQMALIEDVSAVQECKVYKNPTAINKIPSQQTLFFAKPSKPAKAKNDVEYTIKPTSGA